LGNWLKLDYPVIVVTMFVFLLSPLPALAQEMGFYENEFYDFSIIEIIFLADYIIKINGTIIPAPTLYLDNYWLWKTEYKSQQMMEEVLGSDFVDQSITATHPMNAPLEIALQYTEFDNKIYIYKKQKFPLIEVVFLLGSIMLVSQYVTTKILDKVARETKK